VARNPCLGGSRCDHLETRRPELLEPRRPAVGVTVRDEQSVVVEPAARPAKRALKTDRDRRARVLRAVS
jgi:hypothetical protein